MSGPLDGAIQVLDMHVRPARAEDRERLLELWEHSVRATHHFLAEGDVAALRPLVAEALTSDALDWWVVLSMAGALVGFSASRGTPSKRCSSTQTTRGKGEAHSSLPTRRDSVGARWRSMSTSRMKPRCGSTRGSGSQWWDGRQQMGAASRSPFAPDTCSPSSPRRSDESAGSGVS